MKKNILNLTLILIISLLFISSCKKDEYAPSLTLKLEPYVVYYHDKKYTLYDEQGIATPNVPADARKQGSVQSYIDLNTLLIYSVDDNGEFWATTYLNTKYKYPAYRVSSYGDTEPTVAVTYDKSIGISNDNGIEVSQSGVFIFTYTATDGSKSSSKKVHLRVYNSYTSFAGVYVARLSKLDVVGDADLSKWSDNFGYGEAKSVTFNVDDEIDKMIHLNRTLNNPKFLGTINGKNSDLPTSCVFGKRDRNDEYSLEIQIKGKVVDNDSYIESLPEEERDTTTTLVVMFNREVENLTTGEIKYIQISGGDSIPLIAVEYSIERFKRNNSSDDYQSSDGQKWESLNSGDENWKSTFRETYVKQAYWIDKNKDQINNQSGH